MSSAPRDRMSKLNAVPRHWNSQNAPRGQPMRLCEPRMSAPAEAAASHALCHWADVILVVDDHPITLQVVARILRSRGHDARTAPSGHAALHILNHICPTLVILDLAMPDMDGLSILRMLRHDRRHINASVIVFTGSDERVQEALASGAQAVFVKGNTPWERFLQQVDAAA